MKQAKKIVGILLALVMVFALAVPAFAAEHTYNIYQILKGTVGDGGKLVDISAGADLVIPEGKTINDVVEALTGATGTNQEKLAVITPYVDMAGDPYKTVIGTSVDGLEAGYYLIKDADNTLAGADDAYTTYLVKVINGSYTIAPKSAKPSIDKQVHDEINDAEQGASEGWGESADHAINESFQFKLVASLPYDDDLNDYNTYKLVFEDTMSAGVTFESIASVTVDGTTPVNDYVLSENAVNGAAGITFTLTINDLKQYTNSLPGTVVTVIYNAHLNENAVVNTADATAQENNQNKVKLDYSNNPNYSGTGEGESLGSTEYDWVFVLTYEVDNTKYDASTSEKVVLADVGFKLYAADGETEIPVYKAGNGAYYPVAGRTDVTGEEMFSAADGTFNIKGLDAGTYVLKETTTLSGFNPIDPLTIVIDATHKENGNTTSVDLTFNKETTKNMTNDIENKKGSTLPETGGVGTTIFYIAGGVLAVAAAILLVTKKRMSKQG